VTDLNNHKKGPGRILPGLFCVLCFLFVVMALAHFSGYDFEKYEAPFGQGA